MTDRDPLYRRHRFPAEIIAHTICLYFRFPLSLRMVEDMLAARWIIVSDQTIRLCAEKFGRTFANQIRRRSCGRLGDKWHFDEAVISIRGKKHWLWRAVDQDGFVLEVLVQSRRNAKAAERLMRKLLKGQGRAPRVMVTDKPDPRRRKTKDHARRRASLTQGIEQPGRELPSTNTTTRADHKALQVTATVAALRLLSRSDHQPRPHPPPRYFLQPSSRTARCRHEHVGGNRSAVIGKPSRSTLCRLMVVKFTVPLLLHNKVVTPTRARAVLHLPFAVRFPQEQAEVLRRCR